MASKNETPKNVKNTNKVEIDLRVKQAQSQRGNVAQVKLNVKTKCEQKAGNSPRKNVPKTPKAVADVPDPKFLLKQQQIIIKQQNAMIKQQQNMLVQQQLVTVPPKPAQAQRQAPRGKGAQSKLVLNVKLEK
ncbi:uncharacterized protein LOC130893311 [Diorhabda carinulata]|uniref:uncharacterized protein LOC130893311 n=1 Tax=Diorhabda carinulata TaxID=1163345 RepID=UPI0025A11E3E|nr:uncharacterized protein LOC130893311 [Diorhabda carinulata]